MERLFLFMHKLIYILLLLLVTDVIGQGYDIVVEEASSKRLMKSIEHICENALSEEEIISKVYILFASKGYFAAQINLIDSQLNISSGKAFQWLLINEDSTNLDLIKKIGLNQNQFKGKLSPFAFELNMEGLLKELNNAGYPFAKVQLTQVEMTDSNIAGTISIDKGKQLFFGDIKNLGGLEIAPSYIFAVIGFKPGDLFNMEKWKAIDQNVRNIPFAEFLQLSRYRITRGDLDVDLFLDEKEVNQFQGIIGFQNNGTNENEITLTGDVALHLYNPMQYGSEFKLDWKGFGNGGQLANLALNYPYIGGLNIGFDYGLNFQRIDTNFQNVHQQLGLNYLFNLKNHIIFGLDRENTALITVPVDLIRLTNQLPEQLDQRSLGYFMNYFFSSSNNGIAFKKGVKLSLNAKLYQTTFLRNEAILSIEDEDVDFSQIYDTINDKQNLKIEAEIEWAKQINDVHVIVPKLAIGYNANPYLLTNESFLIGGMQTLRGFDEQSIRLANYAISTMSYHYYYQQNSSLEGFVNYGTGNRINEFDRHHYLGFGLALHIGMENGRFSMSYALGKQDNNDLLVKNAKFHFGYIQNL